jgi:hypothetical protein
LPCGLAPQGHLPNMTLVERLLLIALADGLVLWRATSCPDYFSDVVG